MYLKIFATWKVFKIWIPILIFISTFIILYPIRVSIIPCFQKFSDDEFGIMFPRFSGVDLSDHLGEKRINEEICLLLANKLEIMRLDSLTSLKVISWIVDNNKNAEKMKIKYNAGAIFYGNAIKLRDSYQLEAWLDVGIIGFIYTIPNVDTIRVEFDTRTGPKLLVKFTDQGHNLENIIQTFIRDCLPFMTAKIRYRNEEIFLSMVKLLNQYDKNFEENELSGFLYQGAANLLEKEGEIDEAMEFYALSFDCFKLFKTRIDSDRTICEIDVNLLRQFAAFSKMKEGNIALTQCDIYRGLECYGVASSMFPALDSLINEDLDSRLVINAKDGIVIGYETF